MSGSPPVRSTSLDTRRRLASSRDNVPALVTVSDGQPLEEAALATALPSAARSLLVPGSAGPGWTALGPAVYPLPSLDNGGGWLLLHPCSTSAALAALTAAHSRPAAENGPERAAWCLRSLLAWLGLALSATGGAGLTAADALSLLDS